jgi:hypothetical protein
MLPVAAVLTNSCKREETFPNLGSNIASPIDVAVNDTGSHFYVLNSDFDRTYNEGSVLTLDSEGNKTSVVTVPRLGRSLEVSGTDMLVTINGQDENGGKTNPRLLLFDITDPALPVLKKDFTLECSGPINTAMRKDYKYFAMVCLDGSLYVGTLAEDRAATTLKRVRNYAAKRRALILDDKRGLIMGFTTEFGLQRSKDAYFLDASGIDEKTETEILVDGKPAPNEIPDDKEASLAARNNKSSRRVYQFFVYDINKGAETTSGCIPTDLDDCTFPYLEVPAPQIDNEQRWMYFKLSNFDGTPDPDSEGRNESPDWKYYRTNFWDAKLDPVDPNVFYLSHRGPPTSKGSPHANQVVKVTITGDLRPDSSGTAPHTEDVMEFERIYGFKGKEVSKLHYPGEIEVGLVQGQKLLLVNHFRDLDNWNRGDTYFSVAAKLLDDSMWSSETTENDNPRLSWYQLAVSSQGRAISGSFYGNKVILLDVTPGVGIREFKRIE